jgi:hypothetical protein
MKSKNKSKESLPFQNPFIGRDPEEVWKELKEHSKPLTREQFIKRLRELKVIKD